MGHFGIRVGQQTFLRSMADSERRYCEELACTPEGILAVTHRFLPPDEQQKLLALHALFSAIRVIPFMVSDPGIANTKLAWWGQELAPSAQRQSQHPVVRACHGLDVFRYFDPDLVMKYLANWARFVSGEPIQNLAELRQMFLQIGAIETSLEVELLCGKRINDAMKNTGAAVTTLFFLNKFDSRLCGASWWVPLDLQARHGVTAASLDGPRDHNSLKSAFAEIGKSGLEFCRLARHELLALPHERISQFSVAHLEVCRKIAERRIVRKIRNFPMSQSFRPSVKEVFTAWSGAVGSRRKSGI